MELITKVYSPVDVLNQFLSDKKENTRRNYITAIKAWAGYLSPEEPWLALTWPILSQADLHQAKKFLSVQRQKGISNNTLGYYLAGLRGFYEECGRMGIATKEPFKLIALPRGSRVATRPAPALNGDQVVRLLASPNRKTFKGKRNYAILALLFGAGLRRGEVLSLTHGGFVDDPEMCRLKLYNTKTKEFEERSISKWVAKALREWIGSYPVAKKSDRVFPLSESGFNKIIGELGVEAGIGHISPHSGRATSITHLLEKGIAPQEVQFFSGHANLGSIMHYDRRRKSLKDNPGLDLSYEAPSRAHNGGK